MANIVAGAKNIPDAFYQLAAAHPDKAVYGQAQNSEQATDGDEPRLWAQKKYRSLASDVSKLSHFLKSIGVDKDVKVAIISGTRPEWMLADLAVLSQGAVSVSVYQSLPANDIAYILYDSGSSVVVAENQEQLDKLIEISQKQNFIPGTEEREETQATITLKKIIAIEKVDAHPLVIQLDEILAGQEVDPPSDYETLTRDDLAALVYTSGTTGPPKGVMQTHGNHMANIRQAYDSGMVVDQSCICLFLPLAHAFAKMIGYLGYLTPVELRFPAVIDHKTSKLNPQSTTKDIRECSAGIFPVVPRLLEKMMDGVCAATKEPGLKGKLIQLTLWAAAEVFTANKQGETPPILAKLSYALTGGLRKKLQQKLFGSNLQFCLSGGAKLSVPVAEFFWGIGIPVIEGYGLTETAVACTVGRLNETPIGSVGPVMADDIELRLTDDGEICFRGPNIALGYYNRKTATDQSWNNEGWFCTGDLGSLDEKGNLSIVGRKKEIIVTSGGKNIAPNDIEAQMKTSPFVSQAVLIGDGRKYCVALISLNNEHINPWAQKNGISLDASLNDNERVKKEVSAHIQAVNQTLASFETIKKFYIVPEDFTVENGQLTPTFKVKRAIVEKTYVDRINALY